MSIISLSRVFLSNLIKTTWLCFPQYFILRERMKVVKDIMKRIFLLKWSNAGGTQWKAKKSPKSDWLWSWWLKTCPFSRKDAKEWLVQPYRSRIPMPLIISLDWQYLSQSNTSMLAHHIRTEPKNRAWVLLSLEWFFFFFPSVLWREDWLQRVLSQACIYPTNQMPSHLNVPLGNHWFWSWICKVDKTLSIQFSQAWMSKNFLIQREKGSTEK